MGNELAVWRPARNSIHCSDALKFLWQLEDESVDLIVTDPPYGIGYASSWKTRKGGGKRVTSGTFGRDVFDATWLPQAARVLKTGGALYMFTRWDVAQRWRLAIDRAGLKTVQRIVWNKAHWKMGDLRYYGSQTEDILFARKGAHCLRWSQRQGNVWYTADAVYLDGYHGHPTQKPIELLKHPILYSSDPGDLVLDPFMGSGSTAVSAMRLGRDYIGCDLSAEYVAMAQARLQTSDPFQATVHADGSKQLSLFEGEVA